MIDALYAKKIENLQIQLLELRKNEKDFLSRKDLKYLEKFNENISNIQKISSTLDTNFDLFDLDKTKLNNYNTIIKDYSTIFTKIVNLQQKIGLKIRWHFEFYPLHQQYNHK